MMKNRIVLELNLHQAFEKNFYKLSDFEVVGFVKRILDGLENDICDDYLLESRAMIDGFLNHDDNSAKARLLAGELFKLSKQITDYSRFYLKALAHLVSSINHRDGVLTAILYLSKYVYMKTKSYDLMIGNQLKLMSLIKKETE